MGFFSVIAMLTSHESLEYGGEMRTGSTGSGVFSGYAGVDRGVTRDAPTGGLRGLEVRQREELDVVEVAGPGVSRPRLGILDQAQAACERRLGLW